MKYVILGIESESTKRKVPTLVTKEQAIEILNKMEDPLLHKTLEETNGILEVKIKEEKSHISVKIALAKTGTPEQLQFQMKIVEALKEAGAASVGIRFDQLSEEELDKHRAAGSIPGEEPLGDCCHPIVLQPLLLLLVGKVGLGNQPFLSI